MSCQNNSVIGNFMKRLCTCLISMAVSIEHINFETKQKSNYKVDFNLIFISVEKKYFGNILNFLEKFWDNLTL